MRASLRRPLGVALMFATNGVAISSLLPWYPTLKDQWALNDALFGVIVAAIAIGSLLSATLPAWAEQRFGARPTMVVGTLITAALLVAVGFSPNALVLTLFLLLFGIFDTIIDVSQNVAAVRVQNELGKSIMSSLHACWSLGAVLGGALATAAAVSDVSLPVHLSTIAAAEILLVLLAAWMMGDVNEDAALIESAEEAEEKGEEKSSKLSPRVFLIALPVAIVALSGTVVEDIGNNWAALSAAVLTSVSLQAAGAAYAVVYAAQMVGRFAGDLIINRFGRVAVAQVGGACIALGGLAVVLATNAWILYAGYALVGWGCATLVPSAYAASASLPGVAQSTGLTVVSWLMRVGFLTASPLIGMVSELTTLRVALTILPVMGVAVVIFARGLNGGVVKQR